jgi:hypothetical protein
MKDDLSGHSEQWRDWRAVMGKLLACSGFFAALLLAMDYRPDWLRTALLWLCVAPLTLAGVGIGMAMDMYRDQHFGWHFSWPWQWRIWRKGPPGI